MVLHRPVELAGIIGNQSLESPTFPEADFPEAGLGAIHARRLIRLASHFWRMPCELWCTGMCYPPATYRPLVHDYGKREEPSHAQTSYGDLRDAHRIFGEGT